MIGPWGWHDVMRGPGLLGTCLLFLLFLAFLTLVIWLIVHLVRSAPKKAAPSVQQPTGVQLDPVLETLRRRLAEGAITVQEFDELRQKLGV